MTSETKVQDGFSTVPVGPGELLRRERERQALSIDSIAKTMNVNPDVVVALETNDFGFFDAPVFARGYIRQYGGHLNLPIDELLASYQDIADDVLAAPSLIPPMSVKPTLQLWPRWKRPISLVAGGLVALALLIVLVSAWRGRYFSFHTSALQSAQPVEH